MRRRAHKFPAMGSVPEINNTASTTIVTISKPASAHCIKLCVRRIHGCRRGKKLSPVVSQTPQIRATNTPKLMSKWKQGSRPTRLPRHLTITTRANHQHGQRAAEAQKTGITRNESAARAVEHIYAVQRVLRQKPPRTAPPRPKRYRSSRYFARLCGHLVNLAKKSGTNPCSMRQEPS